MLDFPSLDSLREMVISDLEKVAVRLREYLTSAGAGKKGHLESSLSVVELTVALHHVFHTPEDVLIWDVGHQAYGHKVLTDRGNVFSSIRKKNGISGFPSRAESPFDAFGTGHSSTSISATMGMALENKRRKNDVSHIAVIGDGALTGGMAYEALNHLGSTKLNVLVILNDNGKAIDSNVGALQENKNYESFFNALGLHWLGSTSGNNMDELVDKLHQAQSTPGPRVLRVETAPRALPASTVTAGFVSDLPFQDVFGEAINELLDRYEDISVISPAMLSGAGLSEVAKKHGDRVIDTGITEQHATTLCAGIAAAGGRPILHLYSTFAQRAYDQIIHDIALQKLPVVICLDRSGLVGEDGATHHGAFDLSFLRSIPNLTIASPRNGVELRNCLFTGLMNNGPFVIRYPRDTEARFDASGRFDALKVGKALLLKDKGDICIHSTGTMSRRALEVALQLDQSGYHVQVLHHLFVKPLDEQALLNALNCRLWVSLEDSSIGGLGSAISEWITDGNHNLSLERIHLPDQFIGHGTVDELHDTLGMSTSGIIERIKALL